MELLLARHGNTFEQGDRVCWVGARNDLALVAKGREQAVELAQALLASELVPTRVLCGPLKRTRDYAAILCSELGIDGPRVDARLDEIDYGRWSGLTNDEIVERFGGESLEAWRSRSVWPENAGWSSSEVRVRQDVRSLVQELEGEAGPCLLVSSNGRLRYFLAVIEGELERRIERGAFTVRTGAFCKLVHDDGSWRIESWDVRPGEVERL